MRLLLQENGSGGEGAGDYREGVQKAGGDQVRLLRAGKLLQNQSTLIL